MKTLPLALVLLLALSAEAAPKKKSTAPAPADQAPTASTAKPVDTDESAAKPLDPASPEAAKAPALTEGAAPTAVVPPRSPDDLMKLKPDEDSGLPMVKAEPGKPIPLSMEEAIEQAQKAATLALKSQYNKTYTGEQLLQAYAQFLPNLDVQGSYAYQRGKNYFTTATPTVIDTRNKGMAFSVSSTLNLFNGLSDLANWKSSNYARRAAKFSLERARQQITLDVVQAYLQVILDQDVVRIAEKNLTLSQQRENLLEEQTKVGVKNLADLFRQQAQTSSDETYLLNSRTKARNDLLSLVARLRLDETANYQLTRPKSPAQKMDPKYQDENQLVNQALENRADYKAARATSSGADWSVTRSRGAYLPRLDLGFSWLGSGRDLMNQTVAPYNAAAASVVPPNQMGLFDQVGNYNNWTLGLTLSWGIFDRLTTRLDVANAHLNADSAQVDEDDSRLQVMSQTRQAWGEYRASFSELASSRKGLDAAQKAYEVESGRYEVGSASFIDLIASQSALIQSEAARAQAVINYQLQVEQLEFSLGTL